jgi:hypothetical protein
LHKIILLHGIILNLDPFNASSTPLSLSFLYKQWSTFFDITFHKLGIIDRIDGTIDARLRADDAEWLQIDGCITSWIYATVTPEIMSFVMQPRITAFSLWSAVRNLFLNNAMHRAVYAAGIPQPFPR